MKNTLILMLVSVGVLLTGCSNGVTHVTSKPKTPLNATQPIAAQAPISSPVYVTAGLYKDKNDTIYYPIIHEMSDISAQEKVNDELKSDAISPASTNNGQASKGIPTGTYTGDYSVIYEKGDVMNIVLHGYLHTGAAGEGVPNRNSIFVNTKTGTLYAFSDLFRPGSPYLSTISNIVKSETPEKSLDMYTPNGAVVSTDGFCLTDQGVDVYFRPDEVSTYGDQFRQFPVSFEALQTDINDNGSLWKALQDTSGIISEPSNLDVAKVESLGFQPVPSGCAITKDQQNNTLVAILATDPTLGMQTFFFVNDRYLGTDTLKPYQEASLRPNGLGSIDISYSDGEGTGPTITYHWDGHKLQPNKGFPSNWSWLNYESTVITTSSLAQYGATCVFRSKSAT